ncbi:MAG: hypothetical protein EXR79_07585 [Myxococcales bacterium]|nr:hypothetical protein [Myxococcales bacterium]
MRLTLLLTVTAALLVACAPPKKKAEARQEAAMQSVGAIMDARRRTISAQVPQDDVPGDDEHPWLAWGKRITPAVPVADLRQAALTGAGTPVEDEAETLAKWFEAQKDYYLKENSEPNDMLAAQKGAERVGKGKSYEADVQFMALFFHAHRLANNWGVLTTDKRDDKVIRFFTFWKPIFDFVPKTGILEDEVNRLCADKLGSFCKDLPMEDRVFQIMRPYLEGVGKQADAFKETYPQSPWVPFAERIGKVFRAKIADVPKVDEFPVLPPIRSTWPAPVMGNAVLSATEQGVMLMDNVLRAPGKPLVADKPGPAWQPDWAADTSLIPAVSKLAEDVRSTTMSQYNQSPITVVPHAAVPLRWLEPVLRATIVGEHAMQWPTVVLAGRRREDGTNRRAGFTLTLLAADKVVPFKLKAPGGKALACTAWGVIGKDALVAKGFLAAVYHAGDQVHAGKLSPDGTMSSLHSAPPHGEGARLDGWAGSQQGSVAVVLPETATYAQWLEALNGVALGCGGEEGECKAPRAAPVFTGTCR